MAELIRNFHMLHRSGNVGNEILPKGEIPMNVNEILYPVGVEEDPEINGNDLRTLQAEADAAGLLLPAQYNVTLSPKAPPGVV